MLRSDGGGLVCLSNKIHATSYNLNLRIFIVRIARSSSLIKLYYLLICVQHDLTQRLFAAAAKICQLELWYINPTTAIDSCVITTDILPFYFSVILTFLSRGAVSGVAMQGHPEFQAKFKSNFPVTVKTRISGSNTQNVLLQHFQLKECMGVLCWIKHSECSIATFPT